MKLLESSILFGAISQRIEEQRQAELERLKQEDKNRLDLERLRQREKEQRERFDELQRLRQKEQDEKERLEQLESMKEKENELERLERIQESDY